MNRREFMKSCIAGVTSVATLGLTKGGIVKTSIENEALGRIATAPEGVDLVAEQCYRKFFIVSSPTGTNPFYGSWVQSLSDIRPGQAVGYVLDESGGVVGVEPITYKEFFK